MRISLFPKSITDEQFVNRIHDGDNHVFTDFYKINRDTFFKHFSIKCSLDDTGRYRFKSDNMYLDDLYHDSCLRLYEKIMLGKIYVDDGKIHVINRYNESGVLKGTLYNYLESIGDFALKESERTEEHYAPLVGETSSSETNEDDEYGTEQHGTESHELSEDPSFFEEDDKITIVRRIVKNMTDPCKRIFTLRYWEDEDGKMKMSDIAKEMGYASADVAKNQHHRCVEQFKEAFAKAYAKSKL